MMRRRLMIFVALTALAVVFIAAPESVAAQNADLGAQRLGRPYLFVFLAYAIGWGLILGWIVSIARRLRSLERRIDQD